MPLSAGDKLGPYEILAPIGAGGMGDVYKARDTRLDRIVAIKVVKAELSERFAREAKAVAALNHPNICQLFDVGPDYLVMEFIDGAPIAPTDSIQTLLDLGAQIADGMKAAHAAGIVHRDLKPANILVARDGRVKILDFGLATSTHSTTDATLTMLTDPGTTVGTVAYMSPEQTRGQAVDARSDLWSLGVILYEMATRTRPFDGPAAPVIFEAILSRAPEPVRERNPKIPVELERIVGRLLEKDRETRYQSAADVRADLKRVERDSSATGVAAPPPKSSHVWKYATAAGALLVLSSGGYFLWQHAQAKPLTDQDVLVLADFTNTTGDAAFDGALRQALAFELERSPFLKVMDEQDVNQTLQLMGRPAGQRITNDIAHEVCVRAGQKATIGGSIAELGKTYAIALQAINCQTGATLAREEAEAEDKEHAIKAVAKAATGMRAKLGESLSSIQKTERNRTKDDVTTNSLEALKTFQLGFDLMAQAGSNREAIPHFQRAVELDPNFASAYFFLCLAYGNTGQFALEAESLTKAFALVDRVSEGERLIISGWYYQRVAHDPNKAIDAYQMGVRSFPRAANGHFFLGSAYLAKGEYEKALEQLQESARLTPLNLIFQTRLANVYINLDRFDEAKAVLEKALAQKLDGPGLHQQLLRVAYMQDDQAAQQKEIQWFAGKPEEVQSLQAQATNALMHGQRRKAMDLFQGAVETARRQGAPGVSAPNPALIDAWVGDCQAAHKDKAPFPLVICGDPAALKAADERDAKNPPADPDGVALLYRHGEFQKILDHKGRNWGSYYTLAYLGLARAAAKAADTATAKRAYQDFLAVWKDADKDAPYLTRATKELAALP
jgi:tetratricopeptide (TPR) repeat protein/predicted Ser/Thr protein kinase